MRKDLRDIQRTMASDSESECSVRSDEILHSEYPVKPRKTPRYQGSVFSSQDRRGSFSGEVNLGSPREQEQYDEALASAALQAIETIKIKNRAMYDAEVERERLDVLRMVHQHPSNHTHTHTHTHKCVSHNIHQFQHKYHSLTNANTHT